MCVCVCGGDGCYMLHQFGISSPKSCYTCTTHPHPTLSPCPTQVGGAHMTKAPQYAPARHPFHAHLCPHGSLHNSRKTELYTNMDMTQCTVNTQNCPVVGKEPPADFLSPPPPTHTHTKQPYNGRGSSVMIRPLVSPM